MKIMLLAGEESGLIYADAIRKRLEGFSAATPEKGGVAGPLEFRTYADYGFKTADLAVIGFLPVLMRLRYFLNVRRTMKKAIEEWRPDVLCTIDYPGMNLALAAHAKKLGIRTVHIVCPQVWAWRSGRIPRIERSLDSLLCFLPFEPALFTPGFAQFVGHPLVELYRGIPAYESLRREGRLCSPRHRGEEQRLVALLPGSRIGEIEEMLPTMLAALRRVRVARAVIPAANAQARAAIERILATETKPWSQPDAVRVQDGGARKLLLAADAAIVASGTATLEAALAACPTILVYRVNPFVAWIARHVITGVKHLGLANIIHDFTSPELGEEPPMPELLQKDFNAHDLAERMRTWLLDEKANKRARKRLVEAVAPLMTDVGAVERMADEVLGRRAREARQQEFKGATIDEW